MELHSRAGAARAKKQMAHGTVSPCLWPWRWGLLPGPDISESAISRDNKKKRGSDVRILNVQRVVTASEYKTTVLIIKVAFSGTVSTA